VEITRGSSEVKRYNRNGIGQITEQIGPGPQHETWQFDQYSNPVSYSNSFGDTVRREYDKEGLLAAITNGAGERLEYRRDAEGQVIEEKLFDGRVQRYEYDLMGRPVKIDLPDGRTVTQRFDPAGRLVCREASDGLVEEFEYDKDGRVVKAWNNHSVVELKRDPVGRILEEVQNGRSVKYHYDPDGNRTVRSLPFEITGSKLVRLFDTRGRLVALEDEHGKFQELRWDNLDRLVERRCPGQVRESFTYDGGRRLCEQVVESPAGRLLRAYTYDASGNIATIDEKRQGLVQHKEYSYDRQNRLTEVRRGGTLVEIYDYDANDAVLTTNRGQRSLGPGGRTIQDGTRELSYGLDGSIASIRTGGSTRSLKHDVNGRLVEVVKDDGTVIRYEYDPFGRRVGKIVGKERTEFLWEGWTLAAELREGEVQSTYVCPEMRPLAQWNRGERFTPILDQRGAVQEMFDNSGRQRWSCALDTYGNVVSQTGDTPSPFRLRGQYQDTETGLYYNFHRHYDPKLCDYTAPDPIGVEGGYNFYAYPRNPFRWDDPFGLECKGQDPEGKNLPCEGGPKPPSNQTPPAAVQDPPEGTPPNGTPEEPVAGETTATATGKRVHKQQADGRRAEKDENGDPAWDTVNRPITDENGDPIEVPKRVDKKTGKPSDKTQTAIPDAMKGPAKGGVILDDKPEGRPISKDRAELERFVQAYTEKYGEPPKKIIIQRYDPDTGEPTRTEELDPKDYVRKKPPGQPGGGQGDGQPGGDQGGGQPGGGQGGGQPGGGGGGEPPEGS
jgi:RHS repeat-associated protein